MAQRIRQINLAGLLGPRMAGLATLAESGANLGRSLGAGLHSVGESIDASRTRAESKRRFGIESGMEERRLKVAEGRLDLEREDLLNKRAAASSLVDEATALSEELLVRSTLGAPVDERTHQRLQGIIGGIGGVEAASQLSALKGANGGALPSGGMEEDLPALEMRLADGKARLDATSNLLQRLGPLANKSPKAMKAYRDLLTAQVGLNARVNFDTLRHGEAVKRGVKVAKDRDDAEAEIRETALLGTEMRGGRYAAVPKASADEVMAQVERGAIKPSEARKMLAQWQRPAEADADQARAQAERDQRAAVSAQRYAEGKAERMASRSRTETEAGLRRWISQRNAIRKEWTDAMEAFPSPRAPNFTGFPVDDLQRFVDEVEPQGDLRRAIETSMSDPGRQRPTAPAPGAISAAPEVGGTPSSDAVRERFKAWLKGNMGKSDAEKQAALDRIRAGG